VNGPGEGIQNHNNVMNMSLYSRLFLTSVCLAVHYLRACIFLFFESRNIPFVRILSVCVCVSSRSSLTGILCMLSSFQARPKCLTFSNCVLIFLFTLYNRYKVCYGIKKTELKKENIFNDEKVLLDWV
jgi:hypothetical protein